MEHIASIIWLVSWPLLIFIAYRLSLFTTRLLDENLETRDTEDQ